MGRQSEAMEGGVPLWRLAEAWRGRSPLEVGRLLVTDVRARLHPDAVHVRLGAAEAAWARPGQPPSERPHVVRVPLGADERAGVLTVACGRVRFPTRRESLLLAAVASQAALALGAREEEALGVAGLAHDVRTPVTSALTALWLLRRSGGTRERAGLDLLDLAERNLKLAAGLLGGLVEWAGPAVELEEAARPLAVEAVVDDALAVARPLAARKGVSLRADVAPRVAACANRAALARVLVNVIVNAVRFTPPGGGVTVLGRSDRATGGCIVQVRDTGRGIAAGDLDRIFRPFVRVGPRPAVGGAGLGLAVARRIIERYGGSLRAESRGRGRGSTFTVRLPASPTSSGGVRSQPTGSGLNQTGSGLYFFPPSQIRKKLRT